MYFELVVPESDLSPASHWTKRVLRRMSSLFLKAHCEQVWRAGICCLYWDQVMVQGEDTSAVNLQPPGRRAN